MSERLTIEEVKKRAKEIGTWEVLDNVYVGAKIKLNCKCIKREHIHNISGNDIQQGKGCSKCSAIERGKKLRIDIKFIRAEFKKKGYMLLTTVYEDNKQKLEYICPNGHQRFINWNDWQQGKGCPCLSNRMRPTIEHIRAKFAEEDYVLLTETYDNNTQKLEYICPRGHRHFVTWNNWNSKVKRRCPKCKDSHVSKWEKIIREFLDSLHISYMPNDRTQLVNPKTGYSLELDIWLPKSNKAIECNGIYWHGKKRAIKNDKIKKQLCKDQGIDLLVITDEEWKDDTDKCKTKIKTFVTGE